MGNWGDGLDARHLDADVLDGPDGRLATGSGATNHYVDLADTVFHGPPGALLSRHLGGKRRRLAGPFETDVAGRGPGQGVPTLIRNGDDRVVEGTLDVNDPVRDVLPFLLTGTSTPGSRLRHYFVTCFLLATVLRGPLRVRALV